MENVDFRTPVTQQYGRLRNEIHESGNEAFGASTTPEVRDKVRQGRLFRATTDYGENMSRAVGAENQYRSGGYMQLGGLTQAQLVNSSSTHSDPFGTALQLGQLGASF